MTLAAPKLDDRSFQDIVDEAKKRIPHYCEEWTDHNVSDPGVTLIELFAWMTDMILYRLNQVPERHYIKFLDMLGITLGEPTPAKTAVTFWLSKPQKTTITIPTATQVASTQTETERSIVFSTDVDFDIHPPRLQAVISRAVSLDGSRRYYPKNLRDLESDAESIDVFSPRPQTSDALYFGFENDLSYHILGFEMNCDQARGAGINSAMPPCVWEASTGEQDQRWQVCEIESDSTQGMNQDGRIRIYLPHLGQNDVNEQTLYWVRVRHKEISQTEDYEGMKPYESSPRLHRVTVACWGGDIPATHAQPVFQEFLGQSDGLAGQRFYLQATPILEREDGEHLIVQEKDKPPQTWKEVTDLSDSKENDRHYTLDSLTGELRLGPAIRQQERDGSVRVRRYGAIPPQKANLVFKKYRYGGGQHGNVQAGVLNTLKTAIPYITRVENRQASLGGLDEERLESAMVRAPALLRSRDRAVTEADFEFLAKQALPNAIGRVKCLQIASSSKAPPPVHVFVIPNAPQPKGHLELEQLELDVDDKRKLQAYLDERRLLTTQLKIQAPEYRWVAVRVKLRAAPGVDQSQIETRVMARLYHFLNPLTGGPDHTGWPFGRDIFVSDVYQCLQGITGVQFIRDVKMYDVQRSDGQARGTPVEEIKVFDHVTVASGLHSVEFD
jgi:predicted phage baseplate assembly protein